MIKNTPSLSYDTGSGYFENQIVIGEIKDHTKTIEFDLSDIKKINTISVHLVNGYAVVKINNILITIDDHHTYSVDYYRHNAAHRQGKILYFITQKPDIEVLLFNQDVKKVSFDISFIAEGEGAVSVIFTDILNNIDETFIEEERKNRVSEKNKINLISSQATKITHAFNRIKALESKLDETQKNKTDIFKIKTSIKMPWDF